MNRPPEMDQWRTRADYTVIKADGRLDLCYEAEAIFADWCCRDWRNTLPEWIGDVVKNVVGICYARRVLPIRCGARIHIQGRTIEGWARIKPKDRKHEGGWIAMIGPLSFAMGIDQETPIDEQRVTRLGKHWPRCSHVELLEAIDPLCIHAPTSEPFVHGWMEPGELEALAVSLDAAMAGRE